MITNTELEQKGNAFPSNVISFRKDVDTLYFTTENYVALQITILRDGLLRFRYSTTGMFANDFSYAITKYASIGYNQLDIEEKRRLLYYYHFENYMRGLQERFTH